MKCILSFIIFIFLSISVRAQDYKYNVDDHLRVLLNDGSLIHARLLSQHSQTLTFGSDILGSFTINQSDIVEITLIKPGELRLDSTQLSIDFHNSTHYIISPSAYGLRKGQTYYENIGILWNSYSIGITDNFSISVGGEILSIFLQSIPIVFVSPKISFPFKNKNGAFAISSTIFTTPESDFKTFAFVTGSLTLGDRNNNFTIGGGIGWNNEGGFKDEIVPFSLSGMKRISRKFSLITENWLIVENDFNDLTRTIISAGLRIHFDKPGSVLNVGIWRLVGVELGDIIAFPYLSAVIALR